MVESHRHPAHFDAKVLETIIARFGAFTTSEPHATSKEKPSSCLDLEALETRAGFSDSHDGIDGIPSSQSNIFSDGNHHYYGKRSIEVWKSTKGRGKEWRACPFIKHTSDIFQEISHQTKGTYSPCDWVITGTLSPVTCLLAKSSFRQSRRLISPPSPQTQRKASSSRRHLLQKTHLM